MRPTGKQWKNGNANKRITDPRFASVHYDPLFQRMPKRESKIVIDSRFTHMFTDKKFQASSAPVDKRGKRKKASVNPLLHYYFNQEEDAEQPKQREPVKEDSDDFDSETDVSGEQAVKSRDDDDDGEELNRSDFSSHEDSSHEDTEDDDASAGYKGPDFQTRTLQHSKVKLTWEEDKPKRKKLLRGKFNPDQLDELNEYLASSEDSDDENDSIGEENDHLVESPTSKLGKRKRRHEQRAALLMSGDASDEEQSNDEDMEITFHTDLEDLSKRILEKKDRRSETVWEAVLKKRCEKRKARRNRSKHSEDDSSDYDAEEDAPDMNDDFFMEEPNDSETIKTSKKKTKAESQKRGRHDKVVDDQESLRDIKKEQEASIAELELLLADDQGSTRGPKGYNMKRAKVKGKKGNEVALEDKIPDIDVSKDPRFSALATSHLYALDPTDPEYKRSATFIKQKVRKRKGAVSTDTQQGNNVVEPDVRPTVSIPDEKDELLSTIRSLKRNVGTLREQSKKR